MLNLLTEKQEKLIVTNIVNCILLNDINLLSKAGYNFLYLASGFIAHYNIEGFKGFYSDIDGLKADLINNASNNQWNNFREGEENYFYYMQKKKIYNAILDGIGSPYKMGLMFV